MNTSLQTSTNSQASTQTAQLITTSSPIMEKPSAWMRDGYSPTEIILATAILSSLCIAGVATVIMAMTELVKTLAPEKDGKPSEKNN